MKTFIIVIAAVAAVALVVWLLIKLMVWRVSRVAGNFLDFWSELPPAKELFNYSTFELSKFSHQQLGWLEDWADMNKRVSEPNQQPMWDDLLRRIDIALNGF